MHQEYRIATGGLFGSIIALIQQACPGEGDQSLSVRLSLGICKLKEVEFLEVFKFLKANKK